MGRAPKAGQAPPATLDKSTLLSMLCKVDADGFLPQSDGVACRLSGKGRGRGLFATRAFKKGDVVLRERPVVSCAEDWQSAEATCEECMAFLSSADEMASAELGRPARLRQAPAAVAPTPCPDGCGARYCTTACARTARQRHHALLCPRGNKKAAAFRALVDSIAAKRKRPDLRTVYVLAAKVVCHCLHRYHRILAAWRRAVAARRVRLSPAAEVALRAAALRKAWRVYGSGSRGVWWDGLRAQGLVGDKEKESLRTTTCEVAAALRRLLEADGALARGEDGPLLAALVSPGFLGTLLALFERNNLDATVPSPVHAFLESGAATKPQQRLLDHLHCVEPATGSAYYKVHSCINHSCTPSTEASTPMHIERAECHLTALRPIKAGEEITVSYVDTDMGVKERQTQLKVYCFRCDCERCVKEGKSKKA